MELLKYTLEFRNNSLERSVQRRKDFIRFRSPFPAFPSLSLSLSYSSLLRQHSTGPVVSLSNEPRKYPFYTERVNTVGKLEYYLMNCCWPNGIAQRNFATRVFTLYVAT